MALTLLPGAWNSSTESPQSTEEPRAHDFQLYRVTRYIWYLASPIILLLENFGNVMIIIIMRRTKSAKGVINIFFIALAIADLVTLDIYLLFTWIGRTFDYHFEYINDPICKLCKWLTTASTTIGAWLLVGLTAFRAVSVVWPHQVHVVCKRRVVVGLVWGMVALHAVIYSHKLYGYNIEYVNNTPLCNMMHGYYREFAEDIFTYVDLVLYSLLPSACIIVANSVLVWKLRATLETAHHMFSDDKGSSGRVLAREKAIKSVTATVILVSMVYIVLTLPVTVFVTQFFEVYFSHVHVMGKVNVLPTRIELINAVVFLLMFCNSAVNFYLYCLTAPRFKQEFLKIVQLGCKQLPDGWSLS